MTVQVHEFDGYHARGARPQRQTEVTRH